MLSYNGERHCIYATQPEVKTEEGWRAVSAQVRADSRAAYELRVANLDYASCELWADAPPLYCHIRVFDTLYIVIIKGVWHAMHCHARVFDTLCIAIIVIVVI